MKKTIVFILVISPFFVDAQSKINQHLKKQLDSVMVLDQKYRDTLMLLMNTKLADSTVKRLHYKSKADASNHYWRLQARLDSMNVVFVESIFKKYGYPGKTLVDTPANESAWYIIQHSSKIHQYIDMMKKAAEQGELPFHLYAMMLDRDLMNQGKEQVYGTQVTCRKFKNIKDECIVWPIKDSGKVNERRKAAGFPSTVEENAKRLGVDYRPIKLEEVK